MTASQLFDRAGDARGILGLDGGPLARKDWSKGMTRSLAHRAGSSAGTLGRWLVIRNGRWEGVTSMKSWRILRARMVSPPVRRLTAATSRRRPSWVYWQVAR